ncbi:MAG: tetratricopeptide repeat protein [Acidobacteriota bacterium]
MNYFARLFLFISLTAAFCVSGFGQDTTTAAASATWQVQKYDINVTVPQNGADRSMTVKAVLTLKNVSNGQAGTVTLRISPSAEISAVSVGGATADFTRREEKINASASLQRIAVRVPSVPAGGTLTATIDYKLNVKENSGSGLITPAGAQFLPLSFWYPTPNSWYFARGADHAPFKINITGLSDATWLSSGADSGSTFDSSAAGQPFFVGGDWDTVKSEGTTVYAPKGVTGAAARAGELASLASAMKAFVSGFLAIDASAPLRIVAVRRGSGFSNGGTVLVDEGVFRRQKIDSLTAMTIAESVAKLFIGGAIAVSGDGQGVLREGLPRFLATQFLESKYGKDVADVERMRQRNAYAAVVSRDSPLANVAPLDDYYYPEVANKGAMIWRLLAKKIGSDDFTNTFRSIAKSGHMDLAGVRSSFSGQKDFLDYAFDKVTDMNLLVGLPQVSGAETKVALRNTGSVDATVTIIATGVSGEKLSASTTVRATSFGDVSFKTANQIAKVEVDTEKLYPQIDYSDDVAPRETTDSDLLLAVKKNFDKQDYPKAEKSARSVLRDYPRFDDVRIFLARSLLNAGNTAEAEKEFHAVLDEKLPSARSLAWANVGLGEIAAKAGENGPAAKFAEEAILADAEYGASLAARNLRNRIKAATPIDDGAKAFFAQFDKAAAGNRKAEIDALVVPGDVAKFASGISGQTEQWRSQVTQVDRIDANNVWAEANLSIKLLNKEPESGLVVFRLTKIGGSWKLSSVDMFEVR